MADLIQELAYEQLHQDLVELKATLEDLPQLTADNLPHVVDRKHLNVTVDNPEQKVTGTVKISDEISANITNLPEIIEKLDGLITEVKNSKTEEVFVKNPVVIRDLGEVSHLLNKLVEKDTSVKVAAPVVNVPDSVKVNNWPTDAKKPIAVRLSDGQRFINQLANIIAGGGGIQSGLIVDGSVKVVNPDGSNVASNALTDAELRASPVPVDIGNASVTISGPVTVSNEVEVTNDTGNPIPVSASSLPLPTGAATSAKQDTGNTSLSSIDGKVPSKGQATMANSTPVALASNQTAIPVGSSALFEVTGSVTSATTIFTQDVSSYNGVSVQLTAPVAWSGVTVAFEVSNDNTNWQPIYMQASNSIVTNVTTTTFTGIYFGALRSHKYFRVRVSSYTSGTVAATAEFSANTPAYHTVNVDSEILLGQGDTISNGSMPIIGNGVYNGSSWDRLRSATSATGTTGTGLLGAASLVLGTTNYSSSRAAIAVGDADSGIGVPANAIYYYNGSNFDRVRGSATNGLKVDLSSTAANSTAIKVDGSATIQPVTSVAANNSYGQSLSLANGVTATLVNIASSTAGYKIRGLNCTGNGDGYFFIQVAGVTILSGRTRWSHPTVYISLPNPVSVTTASAVTLKVTNESGSTADYEGTLLGE
jgi:hypothetical protein